MVTNSVRSLVTAYTVLVLGILPVSSFALTRWSAVQYIPDADFIGGWSYVGQYAGFLSSNATQGNSIKNAGFARLGLSEWAELQAGYVGGPTFGIKMKVLNENSLYYPSAAIGVTNVLHNKESFFYDTVNTRLKEEYFLAFGKSVDPIRLRLHFGVSTMPEVDRENLDCFFALEKYLGGNAYLTIETFYRDNKLRPSLFGSWRFFNQHVELSGGAVDLLGMFMNQNNSFAVSFSSPQGTGLVRPGIWVGLRFFGKGQMPGGTFGGFGSLEEQLEYQKGVMKILKRDVDSLKRTIAGYDDRIDNFTNSFRKLADSAFETGGSAKLRNLAIEQLTLINSLYGKEDFDAEKMTLAKKSIFDYGNLMAPVLKDIVLDNKLDRKIHIQAMTMLGELATAKSADAVLDIMGQTQDPDVKIEGIIAIGKAHDSRAVYLLDQLANDPNTSIAFTATEVIMKLENRAPIKDTTRAHTKRAPASPQSIPEKKIDYETWDEFTASDTSALPAAPKVKTADSANAKPTVVKIPAKEAKKAELVNAKATVVPDTLHTGKATAPEVRPKSDKKTATLEDDVW
jgi:hypothetical protein